MRRPTLLALRRWGPRLLLAALVATACAEEKPYFGQEILLSLPDDPEARYEIVDTRDGGLPKMVDRGITQVRVRVSGGMATRIIVRVYDSNMVLCGITEIDLKKPGPYEVTVTCSRFDAAPPPPEPDAGAAPDAGPDLSPDSGPSPLCLEYCAVMGQKCPGVYRSDQRECLETCASYGWTEGRQGFADNSVRCRIGAALKATTVDQLPFCYQAGPTGGQYCGPLCYNFCDAAERNCKGLLIGGTWKACRDQCREPILTEALRSDRGNTMECKIFWMGEAGKDDGASCTRLAEGPPSSPCQD